MDVFIASLRQQYAVENIVIINDPAHPSMSCHLKKLLTLEQSVTDSSTNADSLEFSTNDDMVRLITWGERPSTSSSKRYIKQCRWTGNKIAKSDRLSAAQVQLKKDVSPTHPKRRA
jgi:hypothetical protein